MRKLIIAPKEAHPQLLLKYRKDDPFVDLKLYSKEQFLRELNYQCDERALIYLIDEKGFEPELAEKKLNLIKCIKSEGKSEKTKEIYALQQELIAQNLLFKNDLINVEQNFDADIYYYSEDDVELKSALPNAKFLKDVNQYPGYHVYSSISAELYALFSEIAQLLKNGISPNKINVFGVGEDDELIFKRLVRHFNLNFNNAFGDRLDTVDFVRAFLLCLEEMDVDEALENTPIPEEEVGEQFKDLVKRCRLLKSPKQHQIDLYKRLFKKEAVVLTKYKEAISFVDTPVAPEDGYLFIVNFKAGLFPPVESDIDYLSDAEKETCGIVTSMQKNTANLGYFTNLLQQNTHIFISVSERNFAGEILKSPLISVLNLELLKNKQYPIFSQEEAHLDYALFKDLERKYNDVRDEMYAYENTCSFKYNTYQSQTDPIQFYADFGINHLSYSSVKTYYECPFKFYLNNVLDLRESEPFFSQTLGKMAHKILENISTQKSFDQLYDEAYEEFRHQFGDYDWVFLPRIKEEIRKSYEFVKRFESQLTNPKIEREKCFQYFIDPHIELKGFADKIIFTGQDQDNITIIDYKIGREDFDEDKAKLGLSLQLPTYAYLAKKYYPDKQVIGLFIEKLTMDSVVKLDPTCNDVKDDVPLLQGYFLKDEMRLTSIDKTYGENGSEFIRSLKTKKDGTIGKVSRAKEQSWFDEMAALAEEKVKDASDRIFNNEFNIVPKMVDGKEATCTYCPYKDICLKNIGMYKYLSTGKKEEESDGE